MQQLPQHMTSSLWLLSVIVHVMRHKYWYKTLVSRRFTNKHCITLSLSILFLIVAITGILLISYVKGANSPIGLWHYKLGLFLLMLSLIHVFHRK